MKKWKKSDIGKRIIYKGETDCSNNLINNEVVIYNVYENAPNLVGFVEYPISLNSEILPMGLSSKIGKVNIIKSQKKKDKNSLEKAGDWCFMEKVSKDEMRELERIAKYTKIQSAEF